MQILRQGVCKTSRDVELLHLIEFHRLNGYWATVGEAIAAISAILIDKAIYTVYTADLAEAPPRDDWPGWRHVGGHERIGRLYWNWFHYNFPGSVLRLEDGPDLGGTLTLPDEHGIPQEIWFEGDIGQTSPSSFLFAYATLRPGDLWISVREQQQTIIQPTVCWHDRIGLVYETAGMSVVEGLAFVEQHRADFTIGPHRTADAALAALQADLRGAGLLSEDAA